MHLHRNVSLFLLGHILSFATLLNCSSQAETNSVNFVKRDIRCENDAVWVEDDLHVSMDFADSMIELGKVFESAATNGSNLSNLFRRLIQGEDLDIQTCTTSYHKPWLDLRVKSKVVFVNPTKPAALHWLSTFGGTHPGLVGLAPTQDEAQMLVFSGSGQFILLVPTLKRVDERIQMMKEGGFTYDGFFARGEPVRFESTLWNRESQEKLLSWFPQSQDMVTTPSEALIKQLDANAQMSGNDQLRLCTKLKIAKAGYYNIYCSELVTNGNVPSRLPGK